jgi:hypothetical protein
LFVTTIRFAAGIEMGSVPHKTVVWLAKRFVTDSRAWAWIIGLSHSDEKQNQR